MCMRKRWLLDVDATEWLRQRLQSILKGSDKSLRPALAKLQRDIRPPKGVRS